MDFPENTLIAWVLISGKGNYCIRYQNTVPLQLRYSRICSSSLGGRPFPLEARASQLNYLVPGSRGGGCSLVSLGRAFWHRNGAWPVPGWRNDALLGVGSWASAREGGALLQGSLLWRCILIKKLELSISAPHESTGTLDVSQPSLLLPHIPSLHNPSHAERQ